MASVVKTFSAVGNSTLVPMVVGDIMIYTIDYSNDFDGGLFLEYTVDGGSIYKVVRTLAVGYKTDVSATSYQIVEAGQYRFRCVSQTAGTAKCMISKNIEVPAIGAVNQPALGAVSCEVVKEGSFFTLNFELNAAQVSVTDGAGSGSHGSLKLFDFKEAAISFLGCRQNYTAFAEGAALTGAAGDAVFEIGVGTTAIAAAADGSLAAANDNVGGDVNITLSGGTAAGAELTGAGGVHDGTSTAADLYLNWSGTAATIDANSTIDVTGTIQITGLLLGDD